MEEKKKINLVFVPLVIVLAVVFGLLFFTIADGVYHISDKYGSSSITGTLIDVDVGRYGRSTTIMFEDDTILVFHTEYEPEFRMFCENHIGDVVTIEYDYKTRPDLPTVCYPNEFYI